MGRHRQGRGGVPLWRAPWVGACVTALVLTTGASYVAGRVVPTAYMSQLPDSQAGNPSTSPTACGSDCGDAEEVRSGPHFMPALGPAGASPGSHSASASSSPANGPDSTTAAPTESAAGEEGEDASDRSGRTEASGTGPPGTGQQTEPPSSPEGSRRQVTISYHTEDRREESFTTAVTVANDGSRAISGWTLRLHYREVRLHDASGAEVSESGDTVTARGVGGTATIPPGQAVSFEIEASGPDPMPSGCSFNGRRCLD